ncbi:2-methylaconitate cis-trans isomerase PrpF [Acinetobacter qingfengensis]|uniref:Putative methylaconitate Delta-isomerase PrpF n=1 Tax=Acinetobacter qingfengensis TaxID=1262585 RepID=A0A1E7R939_9GAMM|nr:2-methylaconitate cis-trans isomerase PrpF [Acinetobacter qingfengensis]KAA8735473.1 2-methylaconitate cis-trans isomerase PrpF [Acinetobacter qingfengensis]OEY95884.1 putative methylaconitate Delta-isomerase PrpF [Acinetobacter qingfengensis]
MSFSPQIKIAATYMRGGTSKGIFFKLDDLPKAAQVAGEIRDQILLRVMGSPDPYQKQIDGMGGASSSTSKTVIISKSTQPDHDVDYLFGQVSIDQAFVDWSGNCGNLTAAVGAFAINNHLIDAHRIPQNGCCTVRIWQKNIAKTIVAHIPICNGQVQETGDFELDGVTFPTAEIAIEFLDPAAADQDGSTLFPTGNVIDTLDIPDVGNLQVTLINVGIPTIFLNAEDLDYQGTESQEEINQDLNALARFELIRAHAALKMGLIQHLDQAKNRQHTPKIAFVSPSKTYVSSSGKTIKAEHIDLLVRALSMGKLHHAMMGTAAVAIGTAAAIPGTLVNLAAGGQPRTIVHFGHPSGTLKVGAEAIQNAQGQWQVKKVMMSRSARILMEGWVRIPFEDVGLLGVNHNDNLNELH